MKYINTTLLFRLPYKVSTSIVQLPSKCNTSTTKKRQKISPVELESNDCILHLKSL